MSSRALVLRPMRDFAPASRYSREPEPELVEEGPDTEPAPDPLEEAFARGVCEGEAQARREHDEALAALRAQYAGLDRGFAELAAEEAEMLREKLRETVIALCEAAVAPLAIDPQMLARRIERAAAMLQRARDERRIRLNPQDLQEVQALVSEGLILEPDPALARGALRIETADGGIEDGPETWQRAIREALGQC